MRMSRACANFWCSLLPSFVNSALTQASVRAWRRLRTSFLVVLARALCCRRSFARRATRCSCSSATRASLSSFRALRYRALTRFRLCFVALAARLAALIQLSSGAT